MMRSRNEEEHQNPGGLSLSQVEQERQARQQHQPPRASSSTSPYERPSSIGSSAGGPATPSGLDMLTKISMDPSSAALPSPASHVPSPPQPSTSALTATATTAPIPSSSAPPPPPPDLLGDSVWNSEPQEWPLIESTNPTEDYDWGFIDQSLNFLMEPAGGLLDTSLFEPWKEPQPNQPARITADFIRVLIHYTGTVGYRCFITQFQDSVIPAYRASPMLWATARAYHGSYMRQLFSQQANKRDASEHPARAVAIQAMEKELQEVVKNANAEAPEGDDSTNETEASMLIREGEALLQATLHSSAAAPSISFKEILGTLLNMVGYSHTVEGSVPFWRAADRCIEFVQRYQPAKPAAFDVGAAMGLEYRPLCVWISLDVASAVARGTEMNSTYVQHTVVQEPFKELQGLEWLTKASDAIFVVVAQAAALAHELKGRPPRPGPEQERAEGIWRAINDSTSVVNPSYVSSRVICLIFRASYYPCPRSIVCELLLTYLCLNRRVVSGHSRASSICPQLTGASLLDGEKVYGFTFTNAYTNATYCTQRCGHRWTVASPSSRCLRLRGGQRRLHWLSRSGWRQPQRLQRRSGTGSAECSAALVLQPRSRKHLRTSKRSGSSPTPMAILRTGQMYE